MGKKVIFFLTLLVLLIIFTVLTFDYKTILSDSSNNSSTKLSTTENIIDLAKENFISLKEKLLNINNKDSEKIVTNDPINIELVKKDGNIIMNGVFKNKQQAEKISSLLNINREGDYKFNPSVNIDDKFLNKVSDLITPFKDFFSNDSKLVINGNEISLDGELKESNHEGLLNSIIKRVGLEVKTNIKNTPESKEVKNTVVETKSIVNNKIEEVVQNPQKDTLTNESSNPKQIQSNINGILEKNKITFERRSTKITKDSYIAVKEISQILQNNKDINIEIGGHTDSRGKASLNKRISQDRANSVKNALIALGINKSRLKAIGYGEEFPIAKDDKDGLSEINRRVEVKVLKK